MPRFTPENLSEIGYALFKGAGCREEDAKAVVDHLVAVVERAGLDADDARRALQERRFRQAVDDDWARSAQLGVTGVPTFVAGLQGVVGAQPYEAIEQLVVEAGAVQCSA